MSTLTQEDKPRLQRQREKVLEKMKDGVWRTLYDLSEAIGEPSPSVSVRLREFNYDKWAHLGYWKERERVKEGKGTYIYRLVPRRTVNITPGQDEMFDVNTLGKRAA